MNSMNRIESNDMELTRQKWVNEGGIYFPISGDTVLLRTPGGRIQCGKIAEPNGCKTWVAKDWRCLRV